jgi:uncharacterized glyoxalase superfamily protein PhnB
MPSTTGAPDTRLFAYLSYRDAPAALQWLEAVGFTIRARQDMPDGTVAHAEAVLGDAAVMIASAAYAYTVPPLIGLSTGDGLYLTVGASDSVDAWFERAVLAGARPVIPPEDTEWGARRARVLDPQGKEWSVGTYVPGVA